MNYLNYFKNFNGRKNVVINISLIQILLNNKIQ